MTFIKYAAVTCFILAMASELVGFIWLHRLHIAAANPKTLNHKLLKQIFLRFTNCAKLNIQISNTPAFVERYLTHYTVCGLRYTFFEKLGFFFAISGIGIATYGTFRYMDLFVKYALMAILVAIVYAFFCSMLDIREKQRQIVILITDYLDNTLSHRLASRFSASAQQTIPAGNAAGNMTENATDYPDTAANLPQKNRPADVQHRKAAASASLHTTPPGVSSQVFSLQSAQAAATENELSDEIIFSVINDFLV